jgi:spermidine synthase
MSLAMTATGPAERGVELLADADRPRAWMLLVDGVPQSHVDLDEPRYLDLEYVRRIGHVIDLAWPAGVPISALHLGAGAMTLARYVAATRPGSSQLAVESDEEIAELVRQRLPLSTVAADQVSVQIADAREALEAQPPGSFDLVIADVFAAASTPPHVMSAEFTAAIARTLDRDGVYAVNIGDGPPLLHARRRLAAITQYFSRGCLIAEPAVLSHRRYGNLVAAAANRELPVTSLTRRAAADPFPARVLHGAELDAFTGDALPLTDASTEPSKPPPPGVFG